MRIIKIEGKEQLKKVLEADDERENVYVAITEILKPKHFGKKTNVLFYRFMIPPPVVLEIYITDGDMQEYSSSYIEYLSRPQNLFLINEVMHYASSVNTNVCFVCALDEIEYRYLDIATDYISSLYNVKVTSVKKYLKGTLHKKDSSKVKKTSAKLREGLVSKLRDSYIDPVELTMRVLGAKSVDKNLRRKVKERMVLNGKR